MKERGRCQTNRQKTENRTLRSGLAAINSKNTRSYQCLDSVSLKVIALVTMTIDHIAAVFGCGDAYYVMSAIGRIAFPIFCFLLVEGYFHTRNVKRYAERLLFAFVLSDVPFGLAFSRHWPGNNKNVMLTLLLGLLAIYSIDKGSGWLKKRLPDFVYLVAYSALAIGCSTVFMALAYLFKTDYSGGGVALILMFYFFRSNILCIAFGMGMFLSHFGNAIELYALFALVPIALYNGKRGGIIKNSKAEQWFFYLYYPAHLLILVIIRSMLRC